MAALAAAVFAGVCDSDMSRLCGDSDRVGKCLGQNLKQLSSACRPLVHKMMIARAHLKDNCQAEYDKYCKGSLDTNAIMACAKMHRADMSPKCAKAVDDFLAVKDAWDQEGIPN